MKSDLDLCIWTLNSAKTLPLCLRSIHGGIPEDFVCHRIAVDGGSTDETVKILEDYGWEVYASNPGIPRQANVALSRVDTELFASFEHDIIIPRNWFRILGCLDDDTNAIVTGLRVYAGSKILSNINRYAEERSKGAWGYSLDNTAYRTQIVRDLGGFPTECPHSSDTLLREKLAKTKYRWLIDRTIISKHLRTSFLSALQHEIHQKTRARYIWASSRKRESRRFRILASPFVGARIAGMYHSPMALVGYPMLRYVNELAFLVNRRKLRFIDYS